MKRTALLCTSILAILLLAQDGPAQERRVAFHLNAASLRSSLDSLRKWYPVSLVYLDRDIEGRTITASCTDCGFEEALGTILAGTSLTWVRIGDQIVLKQRPVQLSHPLVTVAGTVTDSLSGEWIQDAAVILRDSSGELRRWCPTNGFGFYSLRNISPGPYMLTVHAVGYRASEHPVLVIDNAPLQMDCALTEESITLQEVTVEGRRSSMMPGEGLSKGIFIRSAPAEQTQYLLDGTRIYNPSHFGGVLSTFSPEALNDVEKGIAGLSPYYGGRIGGILDLSLREGSRGGIGGVAGTGSLGSHVALEGPLSDETTFIVSGRRGYPNVQVPSLEEHGTPGRLGSTELIAKLSHRLSGSQRLLFSGYLGRDAYSNAVGGTLAGLSNNFAWGNGAASLRWIGIASPSVFLQASAAYSRYDFDLAHLAEGIWPIPDGSRVSSEYAIEDMTFRAHAEHFYDESHTVKGGVELVRHRITGFVSGFSSQAASFTAPGKDLWELSVYLQDQWRVLPRVTAELGARATMFAADKGSFSAVDPRFSVLVSPSEQTRVFASLTAVNQFLHPYRSSGIFLYYPTIFWYPSESGVEPSTSFQVSLGLQRGISDDLYLLTAESFYETTRNLHEVGLPSTTPADADLYDALLSGTGRSYGLELSVRKRSGDLTGSIGYTLAWADQMFAGINGGEYSASRFDRRHEMQVDIEYRPDETWLFGILGVLVSGEARVSNRVSSAVAEPTIDNGVQAFSRFPLDLNGARLPGFQRLELKALCNFMLGGFPGQVAVRFVNGYGLLDPIVWELRQSSDPRFAWRASLREMKLFPLFPTIGLTFRF
jgi:hypothetical protein